MSLIISFLYNIMYYVKLGILTFICGIFCLFGAVLSFFCALMLIALSAKLYNRLVYFCAFLALWIKTFWKKSVQTRASEEQETLEQGSLLMDLPPELQLQVLSNLTCTQLDQMRSVNHACNNHAKVLLRNELIRLSGRILIRIEEEVLSIPNQPYDDVRRFLVSRMRKLPVFQKLYFFTDLRLVLHDLTLTDDVLSTGPNFFVYGGLLDQAKTIFAKVSNGELNASRWSRDTYEIKLNMLRNKVKVGKNYFQSLLLKFDEQWNQNHNELEEMKNEQNERIRNIQIQWLQQYHVQLILQLHNPILEEWASLKVRKHLEQFEGNANFHFLDKMLWRLN